MKCWVLKEELEYLPGYKNTDFLAVFSSKPTRSELRRAIPVAWLNDHKIMNIAKALDTDGFWDYESVHFELFEVPYFEVGV